MLSVGLQRQQGCQQLLMFVDGNGGFSALSGIQALIQLVEAFTLFGVDMRDDKGLTARHVYEALWEQTLQKHYIENYVSINGKRSACQGREALVLPLTEPSNASAVVQCNVCTQSQPLRYAASSGTLKDIISLRRER